MGLQVKRNKKNQYQLISTVSNERLHDEKWVSESEAKKILIELKFGLFLESIIEIDMTFPGDYRVNDKYESNNSKSEYLRWIIDAYQNKDSGTVITNKAKEILDKLGMDLEI